MKKLLSLALLFSIISFTSVTRAQSVEATDPGFVVLDILLYRPVGFVATLVGGAVFAGMSPLTAFASIPAPHDAFQKTFKVLVLAPAAYTFVRPLGERRFVGYTQQVPHKIQPIATKPLASKVITPTFHRAIQPPVQKIIPQINQDDALWSPNPHKVQ